MHRRSLCLQVTIEQLNMIAAINLELNVKMQVGQADCIHAEETLPFSDVDESIWSFIYFKVGMFLTLAMATFFRWRRR